MPRLRLGAAVALALTSTIPATIPARAAVPPDMGAVKYAPYHVQIVVTGVELYHASGENEISSCLVSGRVVRIFRDRVGDLALKAPVAFGLPCVPPEDTVELNPGPLYYYDTDRLEGAAVMEVLLDRTTNGFYAVEDQYFLEMLDAPTDEPAVQAP